MSRRLVSILAILVAVSAVAVRLAGLSQSCLDGDEIFSVITVRYGWDHTWTEMVKDAIHPPLFYVLLRGWIGLGGETVWWVRLFPALISAAAIVPLWLLCGEFNCRRSTRVFAAVVFAVNPFLVLYAQHMRMYSLLMLLSVTSLWLFARLLRGACDRLTVWGLFGVNLAMVYTQYYGWSVVGLEALIAAVWTPSRRRLLALQTGLIAVLFAPWAYVAAHSLAAKGGTAENLGWIEQPGWSEFLWFFVDAAGLTRFPNAGTTVVLAALVPVLWVLWQARARPRWPDASRHFFLAAFAFLPPLAALVASQLLPHPIWGHRHLIVSVVPFLLLWILFVELFPWPGARTLFTLVLMAWVSLNIFTLAEKRDDKVPWDSLVVNILERESSAAAKVPLYSVGGHLHFPFWFFFEEWKAQRTGLMATVDVTAASVPALSAKAVRFESIPVERLDQATGEHFWVVYSSALRTGPVSPREAVASRGCKAGAELTANDWYQTIHAFPADCESRNGG